MPCLDPFLHRGTGLSERSSDLETAHPVISRLPRQETESHQTMDLHSSWPPVKSVRLTIAGHNLLQPPHHEFAGDNGLAVGICRTLDAGQGINQH
jgi:hypothetical protein